MLNEIYKILDILLRQHFIDHPNNPKNDELQDALTNFAITLKEFDRRIIEMELDEITKEK